MGKHQHKVLRLSVMLLFLAVVGGCASGGTLRSDYDSSADFGSFQTWNFMEDAGPDYEGYESLFTQYMLEAITIEMDRRGYTKSGNPDLLVDFNAYVVDQTKVTSMPAGPPMGMGGYYGYRGAAYGGWGGYGYGTETHVSQYREGTFNIDIVDAKRMQLVWESVGVGRVTDKVRENLKSTVMEGVPNFFALYPFVAGNPTPVANK